MLSWVDDDEIEVSQTRRVDDIFTPEQVESDKKSNTYERDIDPKGTPVRKTHKQRLNGG